MKLHPILVVFAATALTACATTTPYQPLAKGEGYSEQRLETNRYRIQFTGNSSTPRETVENYLMYHAAEVTLQNGYDWFVIAGRDTRVDPKRTSGGSSLGVGVGSGGYGSGLSIGLGTVFGLGGNGPAYDAQADILVYKGVKPADNQAAFDAKQVKANLEENIKRKAPDGQYK